MRYAILADIHANLPALEAVLDDLSREPVDQILIAGDLFNGSPYPLETLDVLRSLQHGAIPTRIISGNNENYLLSMQRGDCDPGLFTSLQWGVTRWTWQKLGADGMDWVAALPAQVSLDAPGGPILLIHGSPRSANEALIPNRSAAALGHFFQAQLLERGQTIVPLSTMLDPVAERVVICGHTHIPWQQREAQKLALNPGSVGAPINGDPRAQYALLWHTGWEWRADFRAVAYDIPRVQSAFETSGLLEAGGGFIRALKLDLERADNTVWKFILHCYRHASAAGFPGGPVIPDDLWLQAEKAFF